MILRKSVSCLFLKSTAIKCDQPYIMNTVIPNYLHKKANSRLMKCKQTSGCYSWREFVYISTLLTTYDILIAGSERVKGTTTDTLCSLYRFTHWLVISQDLLDCIQAQWIVTSFLLHIGEICCIICCLLLSAALLSTHPVHIKQGLSLVVKRTKNSPIPLALLLFAVIELLHLLL